MKEFYQLLAACQTLELDLNFGGSEEAGGIIITIRDRKDKRRTYVQMVVSTPDDKGWDLSVSLADARLQLRDQLERDIRMPQRALLRLEGDYADAPECIK